VGASPGRPGGRDDDGADYAARQAVYRNRIREEIARAGSTRRQLVEQPLEAVDRQTVRMFGRLSGMEFISIKNMKCNLQRIDITQKILKYFH
jgi:hypothetical protein